MQNKEINETEFDKLFKNFGSDALESQSKILGEIGEKSSNIYFKSLDLVTSTTNIIGLIAGFGFTAIGHVQSFLLFYIAEFLLVGSLFYSLTWTQNRYNQEYKSLEKFRRDLVRFYSERNIILARFVNNHIAHKNTEREDIQDLMNKDVEYLELLNIESEDQETAEIRSIYSRPLFITMVLGFILLINSLFISDLLSHFCK